MWKTGVVKVAWLHVAPVKGLGIESRDYIELGPSGVEDDRRFCVVGDDGQVLNGKRLGPLTTIGAHFDPATHQLQLRMANDVLVGGRVSIGAPIVVEIHGHGASGHLVEGPWTAALSEQLGLPIRLVRLDGPGYGHDRADARASATLLSRASLERLAEEAGVDGPVDPRRFRMLIGIDGAAAHDEDGWIGRRVRVGEAVVVPGGNVGRCRVTTLDPDTGMRDLQTLDVLARYRHDVPSSEPLAFGVWARVERAGLIALGDDIAVETDA
ncbi:MAG: MOSC N-terminal beta barrel domain-containing protein [Chloroflexota bacterium]